MIPIESQQAINDATKQRITLYKVVVDVDENVETQVMVIKHSMSPNEISPFIFVAPS